MSELYPGIAFSPQAVLTESIGEADTVIKVSNTSVFPEGPNYATIGTDEQGETIKYAAIADGLLSGCQRGVEGTARAWQSGEVIARNFTALDHAELIAAITEIREMLTTLENSIDEKIAAHNLSEESHPTFLSVGEMEETNGAET